MFHFVPIIICDKAHITIGMDYASESELIFCRLTSNFLKKKMGHSPLKRLYSASPKKCSQKYSVIWDCLKNMDMNCGSRILHFWRTEYLS